MKVILSLLFPFLLFTACGSEESPSTPEPDAAGVTEPAPGTRPQPVVSGDITYRLLTLEEFRDVEGCTFLLWPEGAAEEQYLYGFNYGEGPAEGHFDGQLQTLETVSEDDGNESGPVTFVHANDEFEVTTTVTRERQVDSELWEVSGTVTIRNRQSGATLKVRVLGEQGC
ncbi:hypothetical protein GGR26_002991 [Lewinella marina]|uniref:Lipoprotein n=1 Tax=Neolewinella marina TaxID=438751 RepID=A0A2G0CES5_9BACT|nr:hypothetical protein [Neolewinella marina]NJB87211.1 hypothetical protein [Neolewinella marina]PHK98462.1 hypothetical protein CGL56_12280 [Neolewinella marina]